MAQSKRKNKKNDIQSTNLYKKYEVLLYILLVFSLLSFEFLFCNSIFIKTIIDFKIDFSKYVFSLPRIVIYILLIAVCSLVKKTIINNKLAYEKKNNKFILSIIIFSLIIFLVLLGAAGLLNIMTLGVYCIFINYTLLNYFFYGKNFRINILLLCLISIVYSISCNTFHVLDEVTHVPTAYNIAHGNFSSKHVYFDPNLEKIQILSGYEKNEDLFVHYTPEKIEITGNKLYLYDNASKFLHIPAAIGIMMSETLGGTIMDTFYIGRLFSVMTFLALVTLFLKILNYKKNSFIAILATPFMLLLAGTYSMDGLGFILIALFMTYIFNIYKDKNISIINRKQMLIIILLIFLVSLFKGSTYSFVYILLLLIRKKIPIKYRLYIILSIIISIMLTYINVYSIMDMSIGDDRGGDTSVTRQLHFLFSSPIVFVKVYLMHFLNSFLNVGFYDQLVSTYFFGKYSYIFVLPYILFLILMGISDSNKLNKKEIIIYLLVALLIFGFTSTALYLSFTPVKTFVILGYQARYVFPFLPLIIMCFKNDYITLENLKDKEKVIFIIIILLNIGQFLSSLTL